MTTTKSIRFEITFESATDSGTKLILAKDRAEALAKFAERYEERGADVPTCWISGEFAND